MQTGLQQSQTPVVGIDIGSSFIKAYVVPVPLEGGQVVSDDRGFCPFLNQQPRLSIVNGNEASLQRWRATRSGLRRPRLTYGRSHSKQFWQLLNPKRCFLVQQSEVDAAKLARDTGLLPAAATADDEGWICMQVLSGVSPVAMNDVFAAMVHDVLFDVRRHCDSILGVALTLPNTTSQSGRTLAAAIVRQQVADVFQLHLLSSNANSTYIGIIPEGVAAARDLCETALGQQKGPVRVMTVDAGHSTLDVSQMTLRKVNGRWSINKVINNGDSFCGVKDIAHALLAKLPAAPLQQAVAAANSSEQLYEVNAVLEYVDEAVANGSQPTADASDLARSTIVETRFGELQERAPVTCGDVEEVSKVLSEPADKVVRRNLQLGKLCGQAPPTKVLMTGGGGMVPSLVDVVRSAIDPSTEIVRSRGGNTQSVARGAALLLRAGFMQYHSDQLQLQGRSTRAAAASSSTRSIHQGGYPQLLPDYWSNPLGCSIGVWSSFSGAYVDRITDVQVLNDLKQRVTAAALLDSGSSAHPVPDVAKRARHQRQMMDYIDYRLNVLQQQQQQQRQTRPKLDKHINFYYSLIMPQSTVPCTPVKLPWKLHKPSDGDSLLVQLVRLDLLGAEAETFAGDYKIPAPDADHCVQLAVRVDADGKLVCNAERKHKDDTEDTLGQPLPVETNYDRYATQRRARQQRVQQLPQHVQQFLMQLNGEEAPAAAPPPAHPAAATAPPPAHPAAAAAAPHAAHPADAVPPPPARPADAVALLPAHPAAISGGPSGARRSRQQQQFNEPPGHAFAGTLRAAKQAKQSKLAVKAELGVQPDFDFPIGPLKGRDAKPAAPNAQGCGKVQRSPLHDLISPCAAAAATNAAGAFSSAVNSCRPAVAPTPAAPVSRASSSRKRKAIPSAVVTEAEAALKQACVTNSSRRRSPGRN